MCGRRLYGPNERLSSTHLATGSDESACSCAQTKDDDVHIDLDEMFESYEKDELGEIVDKKSLKKKLRKEISILLLHQRTRLSSKKNAEASLQRESRKNHNIESLQ